MSTTLTEGRREFEGIWQRIVQNAGQNFSQVRGGKFTYTMTKSGGGITLSRTNQSLSKSIFEKAWARRPLPGPGSISDLRGPSYLFAILTDPRIIG